jgi:hypothetical protein
MPCNTITRNQVTFLAETTDADLLARGLREAGYITQPLAYSRKGFRVYRDGESGEYDAETGRLTIPASWDSQEFKRIYSREIVTQQAKENGWEISWSTNDQGEEEATVERQSF